MGHRHGPDGPEQREKIGDGGGGGSPDGRDEPEKEQVGEHATEHDKNQQRNDRRERWPRPRWRRQRERKKEYERTELLPDRRFDRRCASKPPRGIDPTQCVERRRAEQRTHGRRERRGERQGSETNQ